MIKKEKFSKIVERKNDWTQDEMQKKEKEIKEKFEKEHQGVIKKILKIYL